VLSSLKQGADDDDEEAAAPKGGRAKRSFEAMLQAADSGKQKLHQGTDDDALLPKKKKARVESTPVAMVRLDAICVCLLLLPYFSYHVACMFSSTKRSCAEWRLV